MILLWILSEFFKIILLCVIWSKYYLNCSAQLLLITIINTIFLSHIIRCNRICSYSEKNQWTKAHMENFSQAWYVSNRSECWTRTLPSFVKPPWSSPFEVRSSSLEHVDLNSILPPCFCCHSFVCKSSKKPREKE